MSWLGGYRGLGAIRAEGEHLEYSLPGSVVDAMGLRKAMAFCAPDVERFVRNIRITAAEQRAKASYAERAAALYQQRGSQSSQYVSEEMRGEYESRAAKYAAAAERKRKLAAGKLTSLEDTLKLIDDEVAQLRAMGVRGPIPVCVYRASGKKGHAGDWQVIQNQSHERFHAAVRRLEAQMGARYVGFSGALDKAFKEEFGNDGWFLSYTLKWANKPDTIIEELLARVEEQALACVHSTDACRANSEYNAQWIDLFNKKVGNRLPRTYLETLTADIFNRYGSAIGFVKAAVAKYPQNVLR